MAENDNTQEEKQTRALAPITQADADMVGLPSAEALRLLKHFANEVVGTPFFPKGLGENPATILSVVLAGREMGMQPMEALGSFYLSPGNRLGMYAEAMGARMLKAGFKIKILKREKWDAAIEVTPPPNKGGEATTWTFDEQDARNAKLLPGKEDSNWLKYPRNMPMWRCEADAYRFYRGMIGGNGGVSISAEELQDMDEVIATAPGETPEAPKVEVLAGRRPKAKPEAAAEPTTFTAQPEPQGPTAADPLKDTVAKDPAPISKTGEKWLIKIGTGPGMKTQMVADFSTGSNLLVFVSKEHPGVPCSLDQEEFYSNGTSRITTRATFTENGPTENKSAPGPVLVPDFSAVAAEPVAGEPVVDEAAARREEIKQRAMGIYASIPVDPKKQKQVGDVFLNGFFGVTQPKQWPKLPAPREIAIDALDKAIRMYPDKLKGAPSGVHQLGIDMAKDTVADDSAPMYAKAGWSDPTIEIARAARKKLEHDAADFEGWCFEFFHLDKMEEKDAAAFLLCAAISGRGTSNMKMLNDLRESTGKPYSVFMRSIETEYQKPASGMTEAELTTALTYITKMVADRAGAGSPAPVAEPAPAAPVTEDDGWS